MEQDNNIIEFKKTGKILKWIDIHPVATAVIVASVSSLAGIIIKKFPTTIKHKYYHYYKNA